MARPYNDWGKEGVKVLRRESIVMPMKYLHVDHFVVTNLGQGL